MKKFALYFDKDKETAWLNEMAAQGYALTSFFAGTYTFEECSPGKYTYQVDFSDKLFQISEDYREFMRDNDIEIVQTWGFWVFLRKRNADGPFLLYTDVDSSIEHYTKIRNMFKGASILMIIGFLIECYCAFYSPICIFFVFLVAALMITIMNITFKTNRIIDDLKEQKGEPVKNAHGPSPALIFGLLLNSGALIMPESLPYLKMPLQFLAIGLMAFGIVKTFMNKDV